MHGISSLSFLLLLTFVFAAQRKETAALTKSQSQKKGLASTVVTDTEYKKTQRIMFLEVNFQMIGMLGVYVWAR